MVLVDAQNQSTLNLPAHSPLRHEQPQVMVSPPPDEPPTSMLILQGPYDWYVIPYAAGGSDIGEVAADFGRYDELGQVRHLPRNRSDRH